MQVRDLIPRICHHTILTISSTHTIWGNPGRKLPGTARSWCCMILRFFLNSSLCSAILPVSSGFNLQEDDAKFFEFPKSADRGSPAPGRNSKTCPAVPNEFRVSGCKQHSRLIISEYSWVDGERGTIQSSQFQDHRILFHHSRSSPCLAIPNGEERKRIFLVQPPTA